MSKSYNWKITTSENPYRMLTLHDDVKVMAGELKLETTELGCAMTLVKLQSGNWAIHSPIPLTPQVTVRLEELGKVEYVIAPNSLHHLFAGDYQVKYNCPIITVPDVIEKRPDLENMILYTDAADILVKDFDYLLVQGKRVHELVLRHRASKTMLLTDLAFNRPVPEKKLQRLLEKTMGMTSPLGPTILARFVFFTDIPSYREGLRKLNQWDFDFITLCHGDPVMHKAKKLFAQGFRKYLA